MNKSSKILVGGIIFLIGLSLTASYYKYLVLQDYQVEMQIDCDPSTESCFVWECDPEVEDECTGIPEEDIWYYKYFYRNTSNIPQCDPESEDCEALTCSEDEEGCYEVTCHNEEICFQESDDTHNDENLIEDTENE